MSIGSRIKEFAKKEYNGIGILAKKMGIAPSQLSQYTSEARKPSAEILTKLANLGADINYILTGEGALDKKLEAEIAARLESMEAEIVGLKAEMFDMSREISHLKSEKQKLLKTIDELSEENQKLSEANQFLRAQHSRVAEANDKYSKRKLKK